MSKLTKDQKRKKVLAKKRRKKEKYEEKQILKLIEGGAKILEERGVFEGSEKDDGQEQE